MVKLALFIQADLQGVTDITPIDTEKDPFLYTFKVVCNSCHEVNNNWITISRQDKASISGSRGEANFVWRCKNCRREHSASIESFPSLYTYEMSGKTSKLTQFECRGCEFTEFNPQGNFACKGEETNTQFNNVDLTELAWYDYDEKAAEEVSITEIQFSIRRA